MKISFDPNKIAKGTDTIQVEMVRDETSREVIDVASWIIMQTEGEVSKIRTQIRLNQVRFTCFCCGYPVLLRKHQLGGHYFAHIEKSASEKSNCLYQQPSLVSIDDRNRIRYQGQRESKRHIRTKELIYQIIECDPIFSDLKIETVWKTFEDGWRKPDVSAKYNGINVVFEAQVSNTYPQVVAERTAFYKRQNCILIWVYDKISDTDWRTLHSDNFCANGQHIFHVDEECCTLSKEKGKAYFKIYTQRPDVTPYQRDDKKWILEIEEKKICQPIPFSWISIDIINQTATYFSIELEKWRAQHKKLCAIAQADCRFDEIEKSIRHVLGEGRKIKRETLESWPILICAIESARLNKPIGTKLPNVFGVFNLLYDHHPEFMIVFVKRISKFGWTITNAYGAWKDRLTLLNQGKYKYKKQIIDLPDQHPLAEKFLSHVYPE